MHIITSRRLKEFYGKYPDAQTSLTGWNKATESAKWQNFAALRSSFGSASQVGNFIVFNISGNKYRLMTFINYKTQKVFIRQILTHAEYDTNKWKNDKWFEP